MYSVDTYDRRWTIASVAFTISFTMLGLAMCGLGHWMLIICRRLDGISPRTYWGTAHYFIISGVFLTLASIFSWFHSRNRSCAHVYGVILMIFFLGQILITSDLLGVWENAYDDFDGRITKMMEIRPSDLDNLQTQMKCCGKRDFYDWISLNIPIPQSCCVNCTECDTSNFNDIYTQGCLDKVGDYVMRSLKVIFVVMVPACLFTFVGAVLAFFSAVNNSTIA